MRIAVGIVYHREESEPPLRSDGDLELLVRTNARNGPHATPWLGFGANHNRLISEAGEPDWYVALNPDVKVTAEEIRGLVSTAEDGGYSVAAPMFQAPWGLTGAPQPALPGAGRWLRETFAGSGPAAPPVAGAAPSAWVSGACLAIRMKTAPLLFDERYFMYFEDVDMCVRAQESGGRVGVCPEVVLEHGSGWNLTDPLLHHRGTEFARSAMRFARQNGGSRGSMRLAGLLRFGSRLAIPGRQPSERAAARAIGPAFIPRRRRVGLAGASPPGITSKLPEPRRRTLFLTCNAPRNTGSGGEIVSWRLLRSYAELGEVDVVSLVPPGDPGTDELRSLAGRVSLIEVPHFYFANARLANIRLFLRSQVGREPFRIAKTRVPEVAPLLREWIADGGYDLLHCDYLSTAPYRDLCPEIPAVLAEHNVEWQTFSRLADQQANPLARIALRRDSRRTAEWEARALGRFQHTLVLSDLDRALLLEARPDLESRISVWPLPVEPIERKPARPEGDPLTVLVLGSLRSLGRVQGLRWFLREVWPAVRERAPEARLEVVGADPPADIRGRDSKDGVRVRGFVENLASVLDRVDVCAIPLFVGAGIRVKVFELVGSGIPCVGSPVALQGLDWIEGCVGADGPEQWVERLLEADADRAGFERAAARGAETLLERHTPAAATAHLREIVSRI